MFIKLLTPSNAQFPWFNKELKLPCPLIVRMKVKMYKEYIMSLKTVNSYNYFESYFP